MLTQLDRFRSIFLAGLCTVFMFATLIQSTHAEESPGNAGQLTDEQISQLVARMDETRARLNLNPDQEKAIRPVLENSFEKRLMVLEGYGFSLAETPDLSFSQKLALRRDMGALRDEANAQVAEILDEQQMQEYTKIQDEVREQFRDRLRARQ